MALPNVLIVTEKWDACDPAMGDSTEHHNLVGSLNATGLATVSTLFFDEMSVQTGKHVNEILVEHCHALQPDVIVLKMVRGTDLNPSPQILSQISNGLGIKIVSIYGDTFDDTAVRWMEEYAPVVDLSLVLDCYSHHATRVAEPSKYLDTWTPQDPAIFYGNDGERPIELSFVGRVQRYTSRKLALGALEMAGLALVHNGGRSERDFPITAYAELMRQSRITLNFSKPVFDEPNHQCKGRTIEATLCGALLMEERNGETTKWLSPGLDYVEFDNEKDLVERVQYYLAHDDERNAIATAGHLKSTELYNAHSYWKMVFSAVWPEQALT